MNDKNADEYHPFSIPFPLILPLPFSRMFRDESLTRAYLGVGPGVCACVIKVAKGCENRHDASKNNIVDRSRGPSLNITSFSFHSSFRSFLLDLCFPQSNIDPCSNRSPPPI